MFASFVKRSSQTIKPRAFDDEDDAAKAILVDDDGTSTRASSNWSNSSSGRSYSYSSCSPCSARSPASAWRSQDQTLIFFDYDDTLLPTTWLESKPKFEAWRKNEVSIQEVLSESELAELQALDAAARSMVIAAAELGEVCCVTLAGEEWFNGTMEALMPRLASTWKSLGVKTYFAGKECVQAQVVSSWSHADLSAEEQAQLRFQLRTRRKEQAMRKALRSFYGRGASWRHVVSIGDGEFEQQALQSIGFKHVNVSGEPLYVKTVKLMENPNCSQLAEIQQDLQASLPAIHAAAEDVSVVLDDVECSL